MSHSTSALGPPPRGGTWNWNWFTYNDNDGKILKPWRSVQIDIPESVVRLLHSLYSFLLNSGEEFELELSEKKKEKKNDNIFFFFLPNSAACRVCKALWHSNPLTWDSPPNTSVRVEAMVVMFSQNWSQSHQSKSEVSSSCFCWWKALKNWEKKERKKKSQIKVINIWSIWQVHETD